MGKLVLTILSLVGYLGGLQTDTLAEGAILFNPDNGAILFEKNSRMALYPASTTKLVTAIVALKKKPDSMGAMLTASQESIGSVTEEAKKRSNYTLPSWWLVPGATHIGIKRGEELSFRDLMHGMLMASGDDASNVLAEYASGSIPGFVKEMNRWVEELGLQDTHFTNPHGLFHPDQKTTAYDMAQVMREFLKNPELVEILSCKSRNRPTTNKQAATPLVQGNRLLRSGPFSYSKVICGKTGYLALAKSTFVVAAKDKERTLILVLLKVKERADLWKESIRLFEMAFQEPKVERTFLTKGIQKTELRLPMLSKGVPVALKEDLVYSYFPSEEPQVRGVVQWEAKMQAVLQGDKVGEVKLLNAQGKVLAAAPLYAEESVGSTWSWWVRNSLLSFRGIIISLIAIFSVGTLLFIFTTRRFS